MSLDPVSIPVAPPVINYPEIVKEKVTKTTLQICQQVILNLLFSQQLTAAEFSDRFVKPMQEELSALDQRINAFFKKVVRAVDIELNKLEGNKKENERGLADGFDMLAKETQDPDIRKKYVESTALPFVKSLAADLDEVKSDLVDQIIDRPSWEAKRSQATLDLVIKGVALAIFTAASVTATILGTVSGFVPVLVVGGFALGNLIMGVIGALGTYLVKRGVQEGSLFGRFKQFFDLHPYSRPETAKKVCDSLKTEPLRDLLLEYDVRNLYRYGFINQEAYEQMHTLVHEVNEVDKDNRAWQLDHLKEVNKYKKNPEDPEAAVVKERKAHSEAVEAVLEKKWKAILDSYVLPLLPEKEIEQVISQASVRQSPIGKTVTP